MYVIRFDSLVSQLYFDLFSDSEFPGVGLFDSKLYVWIWSRGYKTFIMLNSTEHENATAHIK